MNASCIVDSHDVMHPGELSAFYSPSQWTNYSLVDKFKFSWKKCEWTTPATTNINETKANTAITKWIPNTKYEIKNSDWYFVSSAKELYYYLKC